MCRMVRAGRFIVLGAVCVSAAACSRETLALFFDVPLPPPTASVQPAPPRPAGDEGAETEETPRPAIESTLDADSALALLPRDHAGNIDWAEALRSGVIRPRSALPGQPAPDPAGSFQFDFDFYFPGPNETFDASFPHSTHTQWLSCNQCHSRIFRYRGTPIKMADVFQGKYCGECHGKVAFPVMTGCERCHTGLAQPANRAKPDLLGTLRLARHAGELPDSTIAGNAAGVNTDDFPRARFPHWTHRIRYRCKSCHMQLFEPRSGANQVTMAQIGRGEACGACHNGETAFPATFGYCERCHVPEAGPEGGRVTGGSP